MSVPSLPLNPAQWREIVESHGAEPLLMELSAKNVEHCLSTATSKAPQKLLCHLIAPLVPKLVGNVSGVKVVTSVVSHGTTRSVKTLCASVLDVFSAVLTSSGSKETSDKHLTEALGILLERIVYREDCEEPERAKVIDLLRKQDKKTLASSAVALRATARLMVVDSAFASDMCKNKAAQKAYRDALYAADVRNSAKIAYTIMLSEGKTTAHAETLDNFVFSAVSVIYSRKEPDHKPQAELALCMASNCSDDVVSKLVSYVADWQDMRELLETTPLYYNVLAVLLERQGQSAAAAKITTSLFTNAKDVDAMLTSRKTSSWRLLAAVGANPKLLAAAENSAGTPLAAKLKTAKVCLTKATLPKAVATQQTVQEKLKSLGLDKSLSGKKRGRE